MKVVLLAGGYGTRISEESHLKPKPMIEIDGMPILWHIMKYFSYYGHNDFIICCGYKGYVIKEYFADYYLHRCDVTFDFTQNNKMIVHSNASEPWKVTLVDTGLNTMTGGRIKRIQKYVGNEPFLMTYGDGLCDLDVNQLIDFHNKGGKIATLTSVQPEGRFGVIKTDVDGVITEFAEKRKEDGGWINGGYFVLEPAIFDYLEGDKTVFEREPLEALSAQKELTAYKYRGFWQCMDTMRDKKYLEDLISEGKAPWIKW